MRDADPEHDRAQPPFGGEGLHQIVKREGVERRAGHAAGAAHQHRRPEIAHEQMTERQQQIERQEDDRERPQTELLAELDEQQVDADVGHHIDRRQPRDLGRIEPERPRQRHGVRADQGIAEPAGQPDEDRDQSIGELAAARVVGRTGRARHDRTFVGRIVPAFLGEDGAEAGEERHFSYMPAVARAVMRVTSASALLSSSRRTPGSTSPQAPPSLLLRHAGPRPSPG
ncbi:MAG: hypothetical protein PGN16_17460 [Sphingomonas phyllosphaerae]|uniref:hypothetical protein n=1 Tax=Sphingomonas phyllosphaerae TaxID=257003 RepID=UPI002FFAF8FF